MSEHEDKLRAEWLSKAGILSEALPFMRRYNGKSVVVKFGGHAMGEEALALSFAADIVLLKQVGMNPLVVHGGGPQIGRMLERLAIKSEFIDGLRKTDRETVDIVEMVLSGSINKAIVGAINRAGGRAVGISGKDAGLIRATKLKRRQIDPDSNIERLLDLGYVGEPAAVDAGVLQIFAEGGLIPVIAPIGFGADGATYNINADTAAGAIASAAEAARFMLLTDVAGVLDADGALIEELTVGEARKLITGGVAKGGMIPKIETCIRAVEHGTEAAVILDGRVEHAVLLELFTPHGVGTIIRG